MQGTAWRPPLLGKSLHCCTLMILLALHSQQRACRVTLLILALSMHVDTGTGQMCPSVESWSVVLLLLCRACQPGPSHGGRQRSPECFSTSTFFLFFFFGGRNLTCRSILPMTAIPSRQIQETSRIVGHTARPTPGEAVSPWQATSTVHHDNLMGPPSRGGRIQSRMAPGMYHPCLSGRDTSKPRARRWPLTGGRLPREPTYAPILQPSSDATPCG